MTNELPDVDEIRSELKFTMSRSGGPGGQSVNKLNTKVTLKWDVKNANALSDDQRSKLMIKLANLINNEGELVLTAQETRSQVKNKEDVIRKLEVLIKNAFVIQKTRKRTKPTKASVKKRLNNKKKLSDKKKLRGGID